jgi:hypothetical protein
MDMDKELKQEWIKRLESGVYEQAQETLRAYDLDEEGNETGVASYCCLGVLCDVLKDQGLGDWDRSRFGIDPGVFRVEDEDLSYDYVLDGELNYSVRNYIGMSAEQEQTLITMNDTESLGFDEIAEFIRTEL